MKLSEHFTLKEFTRSLSRPDIPNVPTAWHIRNMEALCDNILEPVRLHFGKPVTVNSGFRSPELNAAQKGAATSQHMLGQAADIEIHGIANAEIWNFIFHHLNFDQVIAERFSKDDGSAGWVHVSYSPNKNRRLAESCPTGGRYLKGLVFA